MDIKRMRINMIPKDDLRKREECGRSVGEIEKAGDVKVRRKKG